ncbi:group III truncated hemoglobin [Nemorincola caseinilytica]
MNDITNRTDIEHLIDTFYSKVRKDDLLGPIFDTIIGNDWSHHLPIMYKFWDMVLFSAPGYAGSPVRKHTDIDKKMPMDRPHFDRWLAIWIETVDEMFVGEYADMAKNKASLMANLIHMKIQMSREGFETLN